MMKAAAGRGIDVGRIVEIAEAIAPEVSVFDASLGVEREVFVCREASTTPPSGRAWRRCRSPHELQYLRGKCQKPSECFLEIKQGFCGERPKENGFGESGPFQRGIPASDSRNF